MILTSNPQEYVTEVVERSKLNNKLYEENLSFRISLQQVTDQVNSFPILEKLEINSKNFPEISSNNLKENINNILIDSSSLLLRQTKENQNNFKNKQIKYENSPTWEELMKVQSSLEEEWEIIINKWHARTHYGSEKKKTNLKVFNQTLWDQVTFLLLF